MISKKGETEEKSQAESRNTTLQVVLCVCFYTYNLGQEAWESVMQKNIVAVVMVVVEWNGSESGSGRR